MYALFLQARYVGAWGDGTPEHHATTIAMFERGLALDPDLVYAETMLGFASSIEGDLEGSTRPSRSLNTFAFAIL